MKLSILDVILAHAKDCGGLAVNRVVKQSMGTIPKGTKIVMVKK